MENTHRTPEDADAYRKGQAAARRGSDLDAAESRYLRRHGHAHIDAWLAGWTQVATSA